MTTTTSTTLQKRLVGVVVSDKGDKTLVVAVARKLRHHLYGKLYTRTTKFHVHDERNEFKTGDTVEFVPCRPLSKTKRWRVISQKSQ
jgi:small subunit ribosomal protein S17